MSAFSLQEVGIAEAEGADGSEGHRGEQASGLADVLPFCLSSFALRSRGLVFALISRTTRALSCFERVSPVRRGRMGVIQFRCDQMCVKVISRRRCVYLSQVSSCILLLLGSGWYSNAKG